MKKKTLIPYTKIWSVRKKFEQGKVILNTARFLGYKREKNSDVLEIVPEEAITVRRIYREFLAGASLKDIADALERDSIPSPSRQNKWHVSTGLYSPTRNIKAIATCKRRTCLTSYRLGV